jgi:thiazole synthase
MINQQESARDGGWWVDGVALQSRLLLGSASYPSAQSMRDAIVASGAEVVTVGLKRIASGGEDQSFVPTLLDTLRESGGLLLPNTAGCYDARSAIETAMMAREIFQTNWVKLEVIGDRDSLQPDPVELVEAARVLVRDGFVVWPYCTDDVVSCKRLLDAGCAVLMPWGAPIGSGQGLLNPFALQALRKSMPQATLIVDAGIGAPSHAAQAMELGFDAVLLCSAVSRARDPVEMAGAFAAAVQAGRSAWRAGVIGKSERAIPSTPVGA